MPLCGSDLSFEKTSKFEGFGVMRERLKEKPVEASWNAQRRKPAGCRSRTAAEYSPRESASCRMPISVAGAQIAAKGFDEQSRGSLPSR